MGAADVIPGVSGGTIAFITGIYEKLIGSLNAIDFQAFLLLFTLKWKKLFIKINGGFLFTLAGGVFLAVFSLAKLMQFLLSNYTEATWSFFFGLIVASIVIIVNHIKKWKPSYFVALFIGGVIAWWLTSSSVIRTPHTSIYIYFAGVVSIVAMILPGISGSFILVILDKYRYIIDVASGIAVGVVTMLKSLASGNIEAFKLAWGSMEIMPLIIFELGTLTGILGFSRILNWLFTRYHNLTISVLIGFLIGSLNKIWPWKITIEWYTDRHQELQPMLQKNVLPDQMDLGFWISMVMALVGFLLVYIMERMSRRKMDLV